MDEQNPLEDRRIRSMMGLFSATIVVVIAILVADGMLRWLMLGIAAVDLVATPYILGLAAKQAETDEEPSGFEN
jgi:hypothetical protein